MSTTTLSIRRHWRSSTGSYFVIECDGESRVGSYDTFQHCMQVLSLYSYSPRVSGEYVPSLGTHPSR